MDPLEGSREERSSESPAPAGRRGSEFTRFVAADAEGVPCEVEPGRLGGCSVFARGDEAHERLARFAANELEGRGDGPRAAATHIDAMRRQELVDYCEVSEKGHHKWYPKGLLIQRLILDYALQLAREWGAFEMKNPLLIRAAHNAVGELMGEFHERDYQVDGGRGLGYLRYASDPLAFPFMQGVRFTHKQTPLKVYEEASCFRNEQDGEVSGLKRVRNFTMTDMHAACGSLEEAREEFDALCLCFAGLMNTVIAQGSWVLGWEGTIEFFESNREWLLSIGKRMNVPAFFKLMPQRSHYYAMKNEYQFVGGDGGNIQISTVQWDVKDGKRFDIGYMDPSGVKRPCPVIIHASSFGSVERTLCAILENIASDAAAGREAAFPYWLAPSQVRLIPVSDNHLELAQAFSVNPALSDVRVDIDDRDETVGKKVRNAAREWIPYQIVLGDRERQTRCLKVRAQGEGFLGELTPEAFGHRLREKRRGMPFRPLPLSPLLSRRPSFFG